MRFLLLLFVLSGCANNMTKEMAERPEVTVARLASEEKYEAAREFQLAKKIDAHLEKTIKANEACVPTLRRCGVDGLATHEAIECRGEVMRDCENDYFMSKNFKALKSVVIESLDKRITEADRQRRSICDEGMRWGYEIFKFPKDCVYCGIPISTDTKALVGEFLSQDQCEEERIKANDKSARRISQSCHKRYLGSSIIKTLWSVKAMIEDATRKQNQFSSLTIHFDSLEKCTQATTNGFLHSATVATDAVKISPKGSGEKTRFVGDCAEVRLEICKKFASEPDYIPETIF